MRLIVLAAGDSFELDGFPKPLIRHPVTGATILDGYLEAFPVDAVTVVVGFRAMEIMNAYPQLEYVFNRKWRRTSNSHSLGLALSDEPCYVVSGDYFLSAETVKLLDAYPDVALVEASENRRPTSLNAALDGDRLARVYPGRSEGNDPELLGAFKVTSRKFLADWRRRCIDNGGLFVGQNLPLDRDGPIRAAFRNGEEFAEVNDAFDYIAFQHRCRA